MPPTTAAVKRLQTGAEAHVGLDVLEDQPGHDACRAGERRPTRNVKAITRSTSIPIIEAASRSNDVARIALPTVVRRTSSVSATMSTTAAAITRIWAYWMLEVPDETVLKSSPPCRPYVLYYFGIGAEEKYRGLLEEERDAERADQRSDPRRPAQRPVREALDHDTEQHRSRPWQRRT